MKIEIIRSQRKTISLKILDIEQLQVRVPLKMSRKKIDSIIAQYLPWAQKKSDLLKKEREQHGGYDFTEGKFFWYLGHRYPLKVIPNICKVRIHENCLEVPPGAPAEKREQIIAWYKSHAKLYIPPRVQELSNLHHLPISGVGITSARSRWASCNVKNKLNFSWRLLQAPPQVIDYVICHELAHTAYRNHSAKFWSKVAKLYPDYKNAEHWLKSHGHLLLGW